MLGSDGPAERWRGGFMAFRVSAACPFFLGVLALASSARGQGAVRVGTASAGAGEKSSGVIEVPAGADAGTKIPVVVVHGAKPGPTLGLVTGAHGTEYVSIIAVEKLIRELDPAQLSGTVILVPLVNV